MRRVFKDDKLQMHFEANGYCIVPLLTEDDIQELERIYYANRVEEQPAMERLTSSKNFDLSRNIKELTGAIVLKRLGEYLIDYKLLYSGFITKVPGKPNQMRLHQDPTFVDETQFQALNVWSPLVDVNADNGALWIIPRSNKFFDGFRGQPIRALDFSEISQEVTDKYGIMLPMKAGEVIIYDAALFHYSLANTTDKARIACASLVVPDESVPIYHYHNKERNTIDVYEIEGDFMIKYFSEYLKTGKVDAKLLSSRPYAEPRKVAIDEFEERYHYYNNANGLNAV